MSHQCQYGQCQTHGNNHSLCASGSCSCSCCKDHHHHDEACHFHEELLELADDAWMELLKEKIKAQIQAVSGSHLDELAKLVNETNHARWHNIFAEKRNEESYKERLHNFFQNQSQCDKSKKS